MTANIEHRNMLVTRLAVAVYLIPLNYSMVVDYTINQTDVVKLDIV